MTVSTPVRPAPAKKKRGRESAGDMVRSLGLVFIIILPIWYLAQPPKSDEATIRVIDPTSDISGFRQASPGVPVPGALPDRWRATSSDLEAGALRIGYVTPTDQYAEYAASTAPASTFLPGITGNARDIDTVTVAGQTWRRYGDADAHTSLVREVDGGTVVVGGVRETATLDELLVLAGDVS